jgi:hypothetical protein
MSVGQALPTSPSCNHATMERWVHQIPSPSQALLKRVVIVVLGFLALMKILFTAYPASSAAIYRKFFPTSGSSTFKQLDEPAHEIPVKIDPSLGPNTIKQALEDLKLLSADGPRYTFIKVMSPDFTQPLNEQITLLATLYGETLLPAWRQAVEKHPTSSWEQEEVIKAADACMKVDYVISCLALEDLKQLNARERLGAPEITCEKTLASQSHYVYQAYFFCPSTYRLLQGGTMELGPGSSNTSAEYIKLFHQKGTVQNTWNQLYNDYCRKVKACMSKEEFTKLDDLRYVKWVQEDVPNQDFSLYPDTQPT